MKTIKFLLVVLFSFAVAACGSGNGGRATIDTTTPPDSGTTSDTTAPTVLSTSPANNATGVATNTVLTAAFSETMNAATLTKATFILDNRVTGTVTYIGTTATFTPTSNLAYSTTYTATITTGAKDTAGNALAANRTWTFTTAPPPAGSLDTSFDTDGKLTTAIGTDDDSARAIAIQSDGKIVAAGYSWNGTDYDFALARYNTDGSLDTSFDTDGKVTTAFGTGDDSARAIAIQSDGKIVAAGYSWNGTDYDFALARYNTDGSLDASFDTDGKVTTAFGTMNDIAVAIAIQSDGKIVAAGSSWNDANQYYDFALARYNTDGSLDTSFDTDGKLTTAFGSFNDEAYAIAIQSDGKIVAAGYSSNGANDDFALARYNTDGSLDTSFDADGKLTTAIGASNAQAYAIAIQSDDKIVAAGYSSNGANLDFTLARYNTDGSLDTSFGADGKLTTAIGTSYDFTTAIAIQSDGKIVAAGYLSYGAPNDFALARYWP